MDTNNLDKELIARSGLESIKEISYTGETSDIGNYHEISDSCLDATKKEPYIITIPDKGHNVKITTEINFFGRVKFLELSLSTPMSVFIDGPTKVESQAIKGVWVEKLSEKKSGNIVHFINCYDHSMKVKDYLLGKLAKYKIKIEEEIKYYTDAIYPNSLGKHITLLSEYDEKDSLLFDSLASVYPLKINTSEVSDENMLNVTIGEKQIVKDVEKFIYECNYAYYHYDETNEVINGVKVKKGGIEKKIHLESVLELTDQSKIGLEKTIHFLDDIQQAQQAIFCFNINKNYCGDDISAYDDLIVVAAGTQPIYLAKRMDKLRRILFIDQNITSLNMWQSLLSSSTEEELVNIYSIYSRENLTKSQLKEKILNGYGSTLSEYLEDIKNLKKSDFLYNNFIESPEVLVSKIESHRNTVIWLSNSFESRVNNFLYGKDRVEKSYEKLVHLIKDKVDGSYIKTNKSDYCGKIIGQNNQLVLLMDDTNA